MFQGIGKLLRHTRLLLWKNYVIKKRSYKSTCAEFLLPILIGVALIGIRELIDVEKINGNLNARYDPNSFSSSDSDLLSSFCLNGIFEFDRLLVLDDSAEGLAFGEFITRKDVNNNNSSCLNSEFISYLGEAELISQIKADGYDGRYRAAIFFDSVGPPQWSYTIRTERSMIPDTDFDIEPFESNINNLQFLESYFFSGFLPLQQLVDEWILTTALDEPAQASSFLKYQFNDFPFSDYENDPFFSVLDSVFVLFVLLTFLWPFTRLIKLIMEEKEQRLREGMRMMGLSPLSFWMSWGITYLIFYTIISLILAVIFDIFIMKNSIFIASFVYFWSFLVSSIAMAFLFSTVFQSSKTAVNVAVFFYLGGYFLYTAFDNETISSREIDAICLYSAACFCFNTRTMSLWEQSLNNEGINLNTWWETAYNTSFGRASSWMFLDAVIYLILAWYFDKVIPSDYGVPKPWYFVFDPRYWFPSLKTTEPFQITNNDNTSTPENFQEHPFDGAGVEIKNIQKSFGGFLAVDDVSMSMSEGEVFVLLGANGAGKSTTIAMLTGLISVTSGDASVYGHSVKNNLDQVQQIIGVCPQHNVLFDLLTVKEHLELFAAIKSVPKDRRDEMIRNAIAEVGLDEKTDQLSSTLSGGQKRKLCVAIAFIGDPKVIFLDEPTSGMDPNSRRDTWNTIKKYKENKVIVLTTHFMDEADILGDRIAIMSNGSLMCCGTSLFLKSRFGVGYTFVVSKTDEGRGTSKALKEMMGSHLKNYELVNDIGAEVFFRIPLDQSPHFPAFFRAVDQRKAEIGVRSYAVSVTTLEEVFLKVGSVADVVKDREDEEKNEEITNLMKQSGKSNLSGLSLWIKHFYALFLKRMHYGKRDPTAPILMIILPLLFMFLGYFIVSLIDTEFDPKTLSLDRYNTPLPIISFEFPASSSVYDQFPAYTNIIESDVQLDVGALPSQNPQPPYSSEFISNITAFRTDFSQEILSKANAQRRSMYGAYADVSNIQGLSSSNYTFWVYTNQTALHAGPTYANAITDALMKSIVNPLFSVIATVHAFPLDQDDKEVAEAIQGFVLSIFLGLSFIFIPGNFVSFVVMEKETKAKHLQMISGVSVFVYWLSNYVWDFFTFLILYGLSIILLVVYGTSALAEDNLSATATVFLLFGTASISFSYLMTFLFNNAASARTLSIMLALLTGIFLFILFVALEVIDSTRDTVRDLAFLFRLFPGYCLNDALIKMSLNNAASDKEDPFSSDVAGKDILYLAWHGPVYFIIALLIEYALATPKIEFFFRRLFNLEKDVQDETFAEDEDVVRERERMMNSEEKDNIVRLKGIRKVYGNSKVAVRNMWFSIPKGECFGFLGVNGAGKTTTLKILSGDLSPTSGTASMDGYDILNEQLQVRRLIGYCPQFDALFAKLTAREHLKLYARIKGVSEKDIDRIVSGMIRYLSLTQYENKVAGNYSGGNKRKLSVAISLIGDPAIVFLDEPSTGMDPVSRRFMWKFISDTMENRAVILTTHSMEECDALCHRIGIMVDGSLSCLGTPQHLKNRFGDGFQLDIRVEVEHLESVKESIDDLLKGIQLLELHGGSMKYRVPEYENQGLADIFEKIENHKDNLHVIEYSVSQTSLEQIFIYFAKQGAHATH